ncbi:MAG: protein-glutamate O-methyltransferase CheR [Clostridiales bacterium]|nr:protein-glutamate O-methyltransferase CheR [Clostridiales bacterium]
MVTIELSVKEFDLLRTLAKERFGINLSDEKMSLVYSRLNTVVMDLGLNSFNDYYKYLTKNNDEKALKVFTDRLTTNHTFFMREPKHFDFFKSGVLPFIEKKYAKQKDARVWCAGCSSGEEAYTLQILLKEHFNNDWDTFLLATDISTKILDKAYTGVYDADRISGLPKEWVKKYFIKQNDFNYCVTDEIRKSIIFRYLNLIDDKYPLKKKVQVIFCRNVMIYFDNETREKIVDKFYNLTEDEGYLFIGHSESLNTLRTNYKYVMPAVYRKI